MDSLTFLNELIKILEFKEVIFDYCFPYKNIFVVKFLDNKTNKCSLLCIQKSWMFFYHFFLFQSDKDSFEKRTNDFVKELEKQVDNDNFQLFLEDSETREKHLICQNPKSLEDILIQSELNR